MEVGTSVGWFFDFGRNLSILFFENLQNLRTSSFGSLMFQDQTTFGSGFLRIFKKLVVPMK